MPKVSVIIPCYNVEKYLRECLDSVINQTLKDIEIICVDDGSTDSTGRVLDDYASKDCRIKVIHKSNSGYGASMNMGLDMAEGEYIGIIESDDFAEINMFEDLYSLAQEHNADIVKSNWYEYKGDTNTVKIINRFNNFPQYQLINLMDYKDLYTIPSLIASCLYKKAYLEKFNINFLATPGASYQDTSFAAKTLMTASRIVVTDDCYYYYRIDNNASSIKSKDKVFYICDEYKSINTYMEKYPAIKKELEQLKCANQFREYLWNLNRLDESMDKDFFKQFQNEFKEYYNNDVLQDEFYKLYPKKYIKRLIFNPNKFYRKYKKNNKNNFISFKKVGNHNVLKIFGINILKFNKQKRLHLYYKYKERILLQKILKEHKKQPIVVMSPFIPYYSEMKQRFQHLAEQLADKGVLVFYCTNSIEDNNEELGNWKYFHKIDDNLYLTNCFNTINKTIKNAWIYYNPISLSYTIKDFKISKKNNRIIYDHIDSFDVGANKNNSNKLLNRHNKIAPLCDVILYSSKKLKSDFTNVVNNKNLYFVPNGVDYEHFSDVKYKNVPLELREIINQGKKIIGTHGALTDTWIDFNLIDKTAKQYKNCNIVLIGSTYLEKDKDILNKLLADNSNIYYIPAVNYKILPRYTKFFDIAIIPFKHGEIALNTNPIKLFENMAMGIPTVVTRDLIECKGYDGVFVSENDDIFLENINDAMKIKDDTEIIKRLKNYAKDMTWGKQADKVINIMNNF